MKAIEIIHLQMEAYNNRDLEANMRLFATDFCLIKLDSGEALVDGKEACAQMYRTLFQNSPELRAEVLQSIAYDDKVILHEYIHGRNGSKDVYEQVILFEVENEQIRRIYRL